MKDWNIQVRRPLKHDVTKSLYPKARFGESWFNEIKLLRQFLIFLHCESLETNWWKSKWSQSHTGRKIARRNSQFNLRNFKGKNWWMKNEKSMKITNWILKSNRLETQHSRNLKTLAECLIRKIKIIYNCNFRWEHSKHQVKSFQSKKMIILIMFLIQYLPSYSKIQCTFPSF